MPVCQVGLQPLRTSNNEHEDRYSAYWHIYIYIVLLDIFSCYNLVQMMYSLASDIKLIVAR